MPAYFVFEDGPAKEAPCLSFARAPLYLRVVRELDGRWDALDQLDDEVNLGDTIFIYKRRAGRGHLKGAKRAESGPIYFYRHTDAIAPEGMEDREAWQAAVNHVTNEKVVSNG